MLGTDTSEIHFRDVTVKLESYGKITTVTINSLPPYTVKTFWVEPSGHGYGAFFTRMHDGWHQLLLNTSTEDIVQAEADHKIAISDLSHGALA